MFSKVIPIKILICFIHIKMSFSDTSKLVKNGETSKIEDFPYSAFLAIQCDRTNCGYFACGASVVNQAILLTAAHCIFECKTFASAAATFGHARNDEGMLIDVFSFKLHKEYAEGLLSNDIALVLLQNSLTFSRRVSRVSLLREPPEVSAAVVAGWGLDENLDSLSLLKHSRQHVLSHATCLFTVNIPDGTLCAESVRKSGVPSNADSGSALVVKNYIQIGLVSYSNPHVSKTITVYTNISYFYDWITENTEELYCKRQLNEANIADNSHEISAKRIRKYTD